MYSVLIMNICSNFLALSRNNIWLRPNKRSKHRKCRLDLGLLFPPIIVRMSSVVLFQCIPTFHQLWCLFSSHFKHRACF